MEQQFSVFTELWIHLENFQNHGFLDLTPEILMKTLKVMLTYSHG